jgi:hypothetical protein
MWEGARKLLGLGGEDADKAADLTIEPAANDTGGLNEEALEALPLALQSSIAGPEIKAIFFQPDRQTSLTKFWEFGGKEGMELKAGEQIVIVVPEGANMNLEDVFLGHRKDHKHWGPKNAAGGYDEHDPHGAYTRVQVFDANTNSWREWQDPLGHWEVKHASRQHSVEYEKLGQWYGMVGDIKPLAFRLIGRGEGERGITTEHNFEMFGHPEFGPNTETIESIYSPGTSFTDYSAGPQGPNRRPRYGGGKKHYLKGPERKKGGPAGYPNAVALRGRVGVEPFQTTDSLHNEKEELKDDRIWINLPAGVKLQSLEVSAGARWWTEPIPDDSLKATGGRKITAKIINKNGDEVDKLMQRLNVGPAGVLIGSPTEGGYITKPGDRIVIEGEEHTSYVMGWRVIYDKIEGQQPAAAGEVSYTTGTSVSETMDLSTPPLQLVDTGNDPGGTQGARIVTDKLTNEDYIEKTYGGNLDRCASEFIANRIYQAMGVNAPTSYMHKGAVVSKWMPFLERFKFNHSHTPASVQKNKTGAKAFYGGHKDVKDGFVVDAWLANWDVFGLWYDNILKKPDGGFTRVDSGGALFYRAQGQPKPGFGGEEVSEIVAMRNPQVAREAANIFKGLVKGQDIEDQVAKLIEVMTDEKITMIVQASGISSADKVIATLKKRRDWLKKEYYVEPPAPAPTASSQVSATNAAATAVTPETNSEHLDLQATGKKVGHHGIMHVCKSEGEWKNRQFIVKDYSGTPDRAATEHAANLFYKRMGIPVMNTRVQDGKLVAKTEHGLAALDESINLKDLGEGFVVDAWLANWSVIGTSSHNIRKRSNGELVRTNNNGSMFFRFEGNPKSTFANAEVTEINSMRKTGSPAGNVFGKMGLSQGQIISQVKKLNATMTDDVISEIIDSSGLENTEKVKKALRDRRDWLVSEYL